MTKMSDLALLIGGYLNQDWPEDYAQVWDAVEAFRREEPADRVESACMQVRELLARRLDDDELQHFLIDELHCGYWPLGDGMTFSNWLVALERALCRE
jgi:CdiI immunity protein